MGDVLQMSERRPALPQLLRGPQVCQLARVSYRQLDYWARTGALIPALEARGSGSRRRWTLSQARAAAVLGLLSELGARCAAMASAAGALEQLEEEAWTGALLVWPDGDAQLVADPREVITPAAFYVDLDVMAARFAQVHPAERAAL